MRWIGASAVMAVALATVSAGAQGTAMPSADAALAALKAGNAHHVAKRYQRPNQTDARQKALATSQSPRCAILACADSRVAPEIVFDQGLGDVFDIRVAGNVAGGSEIASVEYAAEHLHVPLVVVMGHQRCGAVSAAAEGTELHGQLPSLMAAIMPAVTRSKGLPGDRLDNAIRANVELVVAQLRESKPTLADLVAKKQVRIVGAIYSLDTGKVDWLPAGGSPSR